MADQPEAQAARKRKPPRQRAPSARCSRAGRRAALPALVLEPHHVDILALALIAVGIFLGGVAYAALGRRRARQRRRARHEVRVRGASATPCRPRWSPAARSSCVRELRPPARPMRTGVAVPGRRADAGARRRDARSRSGAGAGARVLARGGVRDPRRRPRAGRALGRRRTCSRRSGPSILAVFLFVAGADPRHRRDARRGRSAPPAPAWSAPAGRCAARPRTSRGHRRARRPATAAATAPAGATRHVATEPLLPPEPDTAELVVRATHVEAPPIGRRATPDEAEASRSRIPSSRTA